MSQENSIYFLHYYIALHFKRNLGYLNFVIRTPRDIAVFKISNSARRYS